MKTVTRSAFGKLNLTLDVTGRRPDGYHEVEMLMQTVSLCDEVTVTVGTAAPWRLTCDRAGVPTDGKNLAWKAAEAFFASAGKRDDGVEISIRKRIPMQGGMAGGSADAAAVLRALNELYGTPLSMDALCRLGETLGSDVPFCVTGGTALATGRGERLTPLRTPEGVGFLLVRPNFSVSTPQLFAELDKRPVLSHPNTGRALEALSCGDCAALGREMKNVFQPIVSETHPEVDEICRTLTAHGALGAAMTGTGSVVFGAFSDASAAHRAEKALSEEYETCFAMPV